MDVKVDNLKRHFGGTKAVDGISFTFSSGHIFGFVGPNGAGKTTTMRILATLDEPTDGDATVDGVSVVDYPEKARRFVGFMPDTLPTHRDMTVHEYLDFFARAYGLRGSQTRLAGRARGRVYQSQPDPRQVSQGSVEGDEAAGQPGPSAGARSAGVGAGRAGGRPRSPSADRAARAAESAGRTGKGDPRQLAHPDRAFRDLQRRRDHRAGPDAASRPDGRYRLLPIRSIARWSSVATGPADDLHRELIQSPLVREVRVIGSAVEADVTGGDDVCGELLRHLVLKQFRDRRVPPAPGGSGRRVHDRDQRASAMNRGQLVMQAIADRTNPIVVKELRQAVQSRLVIAILLLFLLANVLIVSGYLILSVDIAMSEQAGQDLFSALFVVLVVTCMVFVPLYAAVRLTMERNDSNIDLLFITTIAPAAIIRGKFWAAVALTALIYSASMPFLTFTYLLQGNRSALDLLCPGDRLRLTTVLTIMLAIFVGSVAGGLLLRLIMLGGSCCGSEPRSCSTTVAFGLEIAQTGLASMFSGGEAWRVFGTFACC